MRDGAAGRRPQGAAALVKAQLQCAAAEGCFERLLQRLLAWLGPGAAADAALAAASGRAGGGARLAVPVAPSPSRLSGRSPACFKCECPVDAQRNSGPRSLSENHALSVLYQLS